MSLAPNYSFLFERSFAPDSDTARPHVTLTYAQSLDGKIAGTGGQQLILSGPESMKATHILRSKHDGILVGIGTLLNDDPRLTVRLNDGDLPSGSGPIQHPQPIILDSSLRFPLGAKLLLPSSPTKPWIFTGPLHDNQRRKELEALGAKVTVLDVDSHGRLSIPDLLSKLHSHQPPVRSLMVEGGAGVISSFLKSGLIDSLLLTIAPVYVGKSGISAVQDAEDAAKFEDISYYTLGRDVMMVARPRKE
ncbi:dihydrofolate reductase-like domain-containing protein [Mortierella sp. GBAus27b]|nr:dihydrofolate reductase-like domain-containing protein [Mortierella sp. GBAus27b]